MAIINEHDFPLLPSQEKKRRLATENGASSQEPASKKRNLRTSLDDLPDELLLEILEYLPDTNVDNVRLTTFPKLALTCRRLYRLTIERVYARYHNQFCEPYLFLRTMVSTPRLTKLVRDVHVLFKWKGDEEEDQKRYIPTAMDKRVIKEGLRTMAAPNWKTRASECNLISGNGEVLHDTILLYTPNVRSISYQDPDTEPSPVPEWVHIVSKAAVGAFGGTHRFEHLRSIKVELRATVLIKFAPLFRMQSLRRIHLVGVAEYDRATERRTYSTESIVSELRRVIPPACNNIEDLALEICICSELFVDVLVSSSRRLTDFKYSADLSHEWDWDRRPRDDVKTLVEILHRHEASLETLHVLNGVEVEDEEPDRVQIYDDMTAFTSLKEITCPLGLISSRQDDMFAERLPSSLVKFHTAIRPRGDDEERLDTLKHMLANCATFTPRLREVRVVEERSEEHDLDDCARLSSEAGIRFLHEIVDQGEADFDFVT